MAFGLACELEVRRLFFSVRGRVIALQADRPFPPAGRLAGEAALLGGEPGVMWTAEGRKRTLARLA